MRILIAGGGASGMTAAIAAARRGARVTILEKKEMPGRCNLTNMDMEAVYFRGGDRGTIEQVLAAFGPEDTLRFFAELGLMTKARGTLVYPVCDQAAAVREALAMELKRLGVEVRTGVTVERAEAGAEGFRLGLVGADGTRASCAGDALILATGGKAAPALGSDGSGYALAKKLGHTLVRPLPALVQLRSDAGFTGKLSGVRVEARVSLYVEGEDAASDTGEVQFTDYGLSGIPVFQVSRFAARALDRKKQVYARPAGHEPGGGPPAPGGALARLCGQHGGGVPPRAVPQEAGPCAAEREPHPLEGEDEGCGRGCPVQACRRMQEPADGHHRHQLL